MTAREINGVIKIVTIPNSFKGVKNVLSGYKNRTDLHEQDGFYNLVKPAITNDQKYGAIVFDTNQYIYEIIDLTAQEIIDKAEEQENKTVKQLLEQFEFDGNEFYIEVKQLVKKNHINATITDAQFKAIRNTLEPALRPLKLGDWDIAKDNIDAINRPTGVLGTLYDFVKTRIDDYNAQ